MYYQILKSEYLGIFFFFSKQNKHYSAVIWPSTVKETMSETSEEYPTSCYLLLAFLEEMLNA